MADNRFNPAYDNKIYQKYSKKTIENKLENKKLFCEEVGLPFNKKVPLLCITYPLTDKNGLNLIQDVINGILEQPVELVFTGIGTEKFQKYVTDLAEANKTKIAIVESDEDEKRKIYAAADIMLVSMDSDECAEEAKRALGYGVIPVIPPEPFAEDYNPNQEKGNAFVYAKGSPWSLFATLIRALENFKFPYDFKNIQISGMELE